MEASDILERQTNRSDFEAESIVPDVKRVISIYLLDTSGQELCVLQFESIWTFVCLWRGII